MKKAFSFGLLVAAMTLVVFPSCKKDKKVTGVKLSEATKSIVVGGEFTLTATVEPSNATNRDVSWASDKPEIAIVDGGIVKGIAEGEATITVTTKDGGKTADCKVTVSGQKAAVWDGVIYMEEALENAYPYEIIMITPASALNEKGEIVAEGTYYSFIVCSTKPANDTDKPAKGNYVARKGKEAMTLMIDKVSYVRKIDSNGELQGEFEAITLGTFTVSDNRLAFDGETAEGKIKIAYSGDYKILRGGPWGLEPKTKEVKTETFTEGSITSFGDYDGQIPAQYVVLQAEKDNSGQSIILYVGFYIKKEATVFTPGTYQVETDYNQYIPGTIQKSPGGNGAILWQMSSCLVYNSDGYVGKAYFFDKGTAVVTDKNIEFNIISHFGSTLKITYIGDLVLEKSDYIDPPSKINRAMTPLKPLR